MGTNKGLYIVKISDKMDTIITHFYSDFGEKTGIVIKTLVFVGESKIIFSFEGDENINVYDYSQRKIVH